MTGFLLLGVYCDGFILTTRVNPVTKCEDYGDSDVDSETYSRIGEGKGVY